MGNKFQLCAEVGTGGSKRSRRDSENIFLRLNDRWALSYDRLQWLVMQRKGKGRWQAVSFIASDKGVLHRVLREKGCHPTPKATNALLHMPERFKEWLAQHEAGEQSSRREAAE